MKARPGRFVKILPWASVGIGLVSFAFYLVSGLARGVGPAQLDVSFTVAFGMFLPLGAFIAFRRPGNPIGWIMVVIGLAVVVGAATTEYANRALVHEPGSLPGGREMAFVSSLIGIPGVSMISFLMLLFPNGHLLSPRWRWVARLAAANVMFISLAQVTLWPFRGVRLLRDEPPADMFLPDVIFEICWLIVMLSAVLGLASLVLRFRRSAGVERQQLKWMAYVAALVGSLVFLQFFVLDPLDVGGALPTVGEQVLNLAVAGIPVAAAIAISRYRLYEIDRVINRTLVYGALTAILVGAYVGLVFGLQALLAPVTATSDLAVAASTLAVAGLFRPVRTWVQSFIDRRFYRRRFDAQRTLEDFASELRNEVDLASLSSRLTYVVSDTMQPAHVSLWIRTLDAPEVSR